MSRTVVTRNAYRGRVRLQHPDSDIWLCVSCLASIPAGAVHCWDCVEDLEAIREAKERIAARKRLRKRSDLAPAQVLPFEASGEARGDGSRAADDDASR